MSITTTFKLMVTLMLVACSPQESPKQVEIANKKDDAMVETDSDINEDGMNTDSGTGSETSESITVDCDKAIGTVLTVSLNQIHTWNFTGTSSSGQSVSFPSIITSQQLPPTTFSVQGSTVTFRPSSQADLSGSLTVNATSGSTSTSKTYTWQSSTSKNGGLLSGGGVGGVLMQLVPKLLGVKTYGNTGYGNTGYGGGIGGLGGVLGMLR